MERNDVMSIRTAAVVRWKLFSLLLVGVMTSTVVAEDLVEIPERTKGFCPTVIANVTHPLYELSTRRYQAIPAVAKTGERHWISWRADDQSGEFPGNYFVIAHSDDGGVTATEDYILTFTDTDKIQITGQVFWQDDDGNLWLFWTASLATEESKFDPQPLAWCLTIKNPEADPEFVSFSKPFVINPFGIPRGPVPVDEGYYLVIDYWSGIDGVAPRYPEFAGGNIFKFNSRKRQLLPVGQLPPNYKKTRRFGFFESQIAQLADGSFRAIQRHPASNKLLTATSGDCVTWSEFVEYSVLGTPSGRRAWFGHLASGRLAIIYNNDLSGGKKLTLAISEDGGRTYPYSVVVEPDQSEGATQAVAAVDGDDLVIAYDFGRNTTAQIRTVRIKESEVVQGTSVPVPHIISNPRR